MRRVALMLLKREKSCKLGVKSKRKKAGWNRDYLLKILGIDWMRWPWVFRAGPFNGPREVYMQASPRRHGGTEDE